MIHASNKRALELCHFDVTKHVFLEGSEGALSGRLAVPYATGNEYRCEDRSSSYGSQCNVSAGETYDDSPIGQLEGCIIGERVRIFFWASCLL